MHFGVTLICSQMCGPGSLKYFRPFLITVGGGLEVQGVPEKTLLYNFWTRDHALHLLADIVVLQAVVNAGAVIPRCPIS